MDAGTERTSSRMSAPIASCSGVVEKFGRTGDIPGSRPNGAEVAELSCCDRPTRGLGLDATRQIDIFSDAYLAQHRLHPRSSSLPPLLFPLQATLEEVLRPMAQLLDHPRR
jgi:hypothetical protein